MESTSAVIIAEQVSKQFAGDQQPITLFSEINLTIQAEESVAIIGTSGAGKSTLLNLLAGMDLPSAGRIQLNGAATDLLSDQQRADLRREQLSFIFQSFHLLPELTALENVLLPLEIRGDSSAEAEKRAREVLTQVGLPHRFHHRPTQLSGGEQQRVAIARAFASKPAILFADEPTGNLDEQTGHEIVELLFDLNREHKTTLILITHDPSLAQRCQRCLRLHNGTITEEGMQ